MISHDAALTAIVAIRDNPHAVTDPSTLSDALLGIRCANTVPGASGVIAFGNKGNPTNKVMPILQIQSNGVLTLEGLVWPMARPSTRCPLAALEILGLVLGRANRAAAGLGVTGDDLLDRTGRTLVASVPADAVTLVERLRHAAGCPSTPD
jgi:hypothetical protein